MKTLIQSIYLILFFIPFALLTGCSALDIVNTVSKVYSINTKKNIAFSQEDKRLNYDLYYPKNPKKTNKKTAVIVFFYGGSWNRGEKSEYEFVGRCLASLGYIVAIPNYRLYPDVTYPAFLQDGAKAISALQKNLKNDEFIPFNPSEKIILMGHSAGGYNAAMLAMDDRWLHQVNINREKTVAGLIGLAGAYNIYPIEVPEVKPVFHHPNYPEKSQPIDFAKQVKVPTLLLVPEQDELVSIERNSIKLSRALGQANRSNTVKTIKDTDHITLLGTLSPMLFFKGDSISPIKQFVESLNH